MTLCGRSASKWRLSTSEFEDGLWKIRERRETRERKTGPLGDWLPPTFTVVTKGRVIGSDGSTSPQVDVIVLKDVYPSKLVDKKHYLAGGVAAAFELKTTLKSAHIEDAVKTSCQIKKLCPVRYGTPYGELQAPILYGLLAHSQQLVCKAVVVEECATGPVPYSAKKSVHGWNVGNFLMLHGTSGAFSSTRTEIQSQNHEQSCGLGI